MSVPAATTSHGQPKNQRAVATQQILIDPFSVQWLNIDWRHQLELDAVPYLKSGSWQYKEGHLDRKRHANNSLDGPQVASWSPLTGKVYKAGKV